VKEKAEAAKKAVEAIRLERECVLKNKKAYAEGTSGMGVSRRKDCADIAAYFRIPDNKVEDSLAWMDQMETDFLGYQTYFENLPQEEDVPKMAGEKWGNELQQLADND